MIGQLIEICGAPDGPIATFAPCNENGEAFTLAPSIVIPLHSASEARAFGAKLFTNFTITIESED